MGTPNRTVVLNVMEANWLARSREKVAASPREHCEALLDAVMDSGVFEITGQTSDGYHTFDELYRYRMLYNAALFSAWADDRHDVHKSLRHADGSGDPGWFIVVAQLPTGQISNHYLVDEAWDLFNISERDRAAEWDGHTPAQAADRLELFLRQP